MRRPPAPLLLLAAALGALGACTPTTEFAVCPGNVVATFNLVGERTAAACPGPSGLEETAPADGDTACQNAGLTVQCQVVRPIPACCFDNLFPRALALTATVNYDPLSAAAALCPARPHASPYLGTQAPAAGGDSLAVSVDTSSAVLGSCSGTCAVTVHHAVTGLVERDPISGAVTGFAGESVEVASATPAATCTPCATPCTATWTLTAH